MDVYFNSRKIKFEEMYTLFGPINKSRTIRTVNVFINLDDVLHKMHNPTLSKSFAISNSHTLVCLTSNIINLAAHYREFMMRQGWKPKVYLFYTSFIHGPFRNSVYRETYRDHFMNINSNLNQNYAGMNAAIPNAINLVRSICQYIEGVYCIDSEFLEPSIIPLMISKMEIADLNIVVTRDQYDYQYAAIDDWAVLYANSMDQKARLIQAQNIWKVLGEQEKVKEEKWSLNYPASLYSFGLAIIGNRYRGIPRIRRCGWKTVLSIFDEFSKEPTSISSATMRIRTLDKLQGKNKATIEDINNNLACTDIVQQYGRMDVSGNPSISANITTQMTDIPDYENLLTVDRIYFEKAHLNIPFLTKQLGDVTVSDKKFKLDRKVRHI